MFNPAINETTNYAESDSLLFLYCSPSHHLKDSLPTSDAKSAAASATA